MEQGYDCEGNIKYLTIKSDKEFCDNTYQLKMLTKNNIDGFLNVGIRKINNITYYYYNITSLRQFTKFALIGRMEIEQIRTICYGIQKAAYSAENYMLDMDCVLLNPEYIFMDIDRKDIYLLYNPDEKMDIHQKIKTLFEYILENFDHTCPKEELMVIYSVYQKIVDGNYELLSFSGILDDNLNDKKINDNEKNNKTENIEDINTIKTIQDFSNNEDIFIKKNNSEDFYKNSFENKYENKYKIINSKENTLIRNWVIFLLKIISIIIFLYAAASLFLPQYLVVVPDMIMSFILLFIGMTIFIAISKLSHKKTVDNEINNNTNSKIDEEKVNLESVKNNYLDQIENSDQRTMESIKSNEELTKKYMETTILSEFGKEEKKNGLWFVICDNDDEDDLNKRVTIKKFPSILGNSKEYSDVVISNKFISRMHCCFYKENENYYIEDVNSSNGTFINGKRIKPNQKMEIKVNDKVTFANVTYMVEG